MKKLFALILALVLSFSVVGCGAEPITTPAPDATVHAILDVVLLDDYAKIQALFGYTSTEDVIKDLFGGQSVSAEILDGAKEAMLGADLNLSDEDLALLVDAIFGAIGRADITCETVSIDEENGVAIVAVTTTTYPPETLEEDFIAAMQPVLMENLDLLTDEDALYSLIVRELVKFLNDLTPSDETVTINITCTLEETEVRGQTVSVWMPDAEALGEDIASAVLAI